MKIKSLHIADFNQFQDFSLDLTYPAGHEKAGEPLDKVCIIGQSGTGKTSLLNLLASNIFHRKVLSLKEDLESYNNLYNSSARKADSSGPNVVGLSHRQNNYIQHLKYFDQITKSYLNTHTELDTGEIENYINPLHYVATKKVANNWFFPPTYYFTTRPTTSNESLNKVVKTIKDSLNFKLFNLNIDTKTFWDRIISEIQSFQEEEIKRSQAIVKIKDFSKFEKEQKEYGEWLASDYNPLNKLGKNFLDTVLNHFNLRVKTDFNFKAKENIGELVLETLQGIEVPSSVWSTGTNQIVNTAIPIYADKPQNALIFFDEPERSLYPDIQTKIVDFYTSLAPDSQFFFATHSPLVASSFDPWEIVELKFNEDGTVYQDIYYKGERHVDNYYIHPKLLRWDSILKRVFDLDTEGNEARREQLTKLATLESRLKSESQPLPLEEKNKAWEEYRKLSKLLDWKTQ